MPQTKTPKNWLTKWFIHIPKIAYGNGSKLRSFQILKLFSFWIWIPNKIAPNFDNSFPPPPPPPPKKKKNSRNLKLGYMGNFTTRSGNAISTNYCIAIACVNYCVGECLMLAVQHLLKLRLQKYWRLLGKTHKSILLQVMFFAHFSQTPPPPMPETFQSKIDNQFKMCVLADADDA